MKLLIRWGALATAFWVATSVVTGIHVDGGLKTYLWVALIFWTYQCTSRRFNPLSNFANYFPFVWIVFGGY
jgi:uncharacterized membrane protein YvlD (DUF360 family)